TYLAMELLWHYRNCSACWATSRNYYVIRVYDLPSTRWRFFPCKFLGSKNYPGLDIDRRDIDVLKCCVGFFGGVSLGFNNVSTFVNWNEYLLWEMSDPYRRVVEVNVPT